MKRYQSHWHAVSVLFFVACSTLLSQIDAGSRQSVSRQGHSDMPDMSRAVDGKQWIAWKALSQESGHSLIRVVKMEGGKPEPPIIAYQTSRDLLSPCIELTDDGSLHLVWVESSDQGWDIHSAMMRQGEIDRHRQLTKGGTSFRPKIASRNDVLWLTWQSRQEGNMNVYARKCENGQWSAPVRLSQNRSANRAPDIGVGRDGRAWVAWDSYRNGNYDIYLRGFDPKRSEWSQRKRLTTSMQLDMEPSVTVDPKGRVWTVWTRAPRWGKYHYRLNVGKRLLLRGYDPANNDLLQAKGRGLADREGIVPIPVDPWGRRLPVTPTLLADRDGALHLLYRQFRDEGGNDWGWCIDHIATTSDGWTEPTRIESQPGLQMGTIASALGAHSRLSIAYQAVGYSGGRSALQDDNSKIYSREITASSVGPPTTAKSVLPGGRHLEEFDVPRPKRKVPPTWQRNGKPRRLLWGELHQHTSQSKDVPERDGTLRDAYRWAHDVAHLDFFTTTDHTEMMSDHEAHRARIWADLYNHSGAMVTLYGAEQNFATTEHSNFFAVDRTAARLYRRARLDFDELPAALDWLDDQGMRGKILVIRHFHGRTPRTSAPPLVPGYEHDIEAVQTRGFASKALDHYLSQDAHPGVVGGPDHSRPPGGWGGPWVYPYALTGVWAGSRTREGVFEALYNRRAYATNGKKIEVRFSTKNHLLGSSIRTSTATRFHVSATGTTPLKKVELIRDGKPIVTKTSDTRTLSFDHKDDETGKHYYYVRVVQHREEGDNYSGRAITSPIWVHREE